MPGGIQLTLTRSRMETTKGASQLNSERKRLLDIEVDRKKLLVTFKGIIAVFLAVVLFTTSATCVQLLERRIPDMELNTFRLGVPLLFYAAGLVILRRWPVIDRSQIWATLAFAFVTSSSALAEFVAVTFLPAATVFCLNTTSTIMTGLLVFAICWDELVTLKKTLFALLCVGGVIMVIQPWIDWNIFYQKTVRENRTDESNMMGLNKSNGPMIGEKNILMNQMIGYTAAIGSGILLSLEILVVKRNPYIKDHPIEVLFWGWSFGTGVSLIAMFIIETPVLPGNWFDISMVTIHSATCAAITPLIIYGSNTVSGNTVTIIVSTKVVLMLISQYTVLSSILPGHRNWIEVVGVFLVLLGSSMSSVMELVLNKSKD